MSLSVLAPARAAWWAHRAARRARRHLADGRLDDLVVLPPPSPLRGRRFVVAVLRARRDSCLVRSAVLQQWDAAHGWPRDLVIGVTSPAEGFRAHAWLEGDGARSSAGFQELTRRPPPPRRVETP